MHVATVLHSVYGLTQQSCLQRIEHADYLDEQPLSCRRHLWKYFCFFKVKSGHLPHWECVLSRSRHGTIEERGWRVGCNEYLLCQGERTRMKERGLMCKKYRNFMRCCYSGLT